MSETLDLLGMSTNLVDPVLSAAYYARVLPLLRRADDRRGLAADLVTHAIQGGFFANDTFATAVLDDAQSERDLDEALQLTRAIPWPAGESFALWESAAWLGFRGRFAEALQKAEASLRVAEQIEHRQWTIGALWSLGGLFVSVLVPERATPLLERALALSEELASEMWTPLVASMLALAHLQHGRLADAHAVLGRVLGPDSPVEVMSTRLAWAARAELALAQRDSTTALSILDRLLETVPSGRVVPRLSLLHGRALQLKGSARDAEQLLTVAEASAAQAGIRPLLVHVRAALARLLRAGGRRDEADAKIQSALHLIDELAADIPEPSLRETFAGRARSLLPRHAALPNGGSPKQPPGASPHASARWHDSSRQALRIGRSPMRWCLASAPSKATSAAS